MFDIVHKADLYILNNMRRRIVIKGPGPRDEIPKIPRETVRTMEIGRASCRERV